MLARDEEDNEEVEENFLEPEVGEVSDHEPQIEGTEDEFGNYIEVPEQIGDAEEAEEILRDNDIMNMQREYQFWEARYSETLARM